MAWAVGIAGLLALIALGVPIAFAMTAVGMAVFVSGVTALELPMPVVVPWSELAVVLAICAAIVIAATTLPVLPSLRKPARQVVAQLAAE